MSGYAPVQVYTQERIHIELAEVKIQISGPVVAQVAPPDGARFFKLTPGDFGSTPRDRVDGEVAGALLIEVSRGYESPR
jgi:hypothetical protein